MRKMKAKFFIICSIGLLLASCGNDGRGYEYMPDMYRSPSLETYGKNKVFSDSLNARDPVKGTIARGYLTTFNFGPSQEDYLLAGKKATNPYDSNDKNTDEGKALYAMFCKHCHGPNGAGGGSITHPVYSAIPHYSDSIQVRRSGNTMRELTSGQIFHAITYGLNAMGPHSSQLTEEERWKVVLYVQALQNYSNE